jgi:hypothetical protein
MMYENVIVLRHSPNWLEFDLDDSKTFCTSGGLPEATVIHFASSWDRSVSLTYREFRHALKDISWENFQSVKSAVVLHQHEFEVEKVSDDTLIAFVDDDDWFSPELFDPLRRAGDAEGYFWGSIRLGHRFIGDIALHHPHEVGASALTYRPISSVIYTNNYVVRGSALRRAGLATYLEHYSAEAAMKAGQFQPTLIPAYLSCANKHPACTVAAHDFNTAEEFRKHPRATLARAFAEIGEVADVIAADPNSWLKRPFSRYRELLALTLA